VVGLRDRALIALLVYTFARIGAALGVNVGDIYWQHRRLWVRLHEKGGKEHAMPCHHHLKSYPQDYLDVAGITRDQDGAVFRTIVGRVGI
jgi:integrase/recombinase XerC